MAYGNVSISVSVNSSIDSAMTGVVMKEIFACKASAAIRRRLVAMKQAVKHRRRKQMTINGGGGVTNGNVGVCHVAAQWRLT